MIQEFKQRQFPAGNPLANALVIVVGVLVIAVSFVLGVVALVALLAAAVVMAAIIGVRVWWLNRKIGRARKNSGNQAGQTTTSAEIIEGEFKVVAHDKDRDATQ
jgi:membrane protein implicated in regulation of membrane protease activity